MSAFCSETDASNQIASAAAGKCKGAREGERRRCDILSFKVKGMKVVTKSNGNVAILKQGESRCFSERRELMQGSCKGEKKS